MHPNSLFSLFRGNPGFISRPCASYVCGHYRVIYYHLGRAYTVHVHTNIYVRIRYTGNTFVILGHSKWNMDVFDVFDNILLLIGAKIISKIPTSRQATSTTKNEIRKCFP